MTSANIYFESLDELPEPQPFPQVAQQIMVLCDSPDVDAQQLEQVIQCDPAISVRLLKAANSSLYGFSGEIRSVGHAIVALGLRSVKDLGISFAAAAMFDSGSHAADRKQLWLHSLACGSVAAQLAPYANVVASEAFLAGVVHDVGKLLLIDALQEDYIAKLRDPAIRDMIEIENTEYGVNHQQVGGRCADEWGLPIEINSAIEFHHLPEEAEIAPELANVVFAANHLAKHWSLGGMSIPQDNLSDVMQRCNLVLTENQLQEVETRAAQQMQQMQTACE